MTPRTGRSMTDRDQMVLPHEDAGFPVGYLLTFEVGLLDDGEELIAVNVDLGHLHAVESVLHPQRMKAEHCGEIGHLVRGGSVTPIQMNSPSRASTGVATSGTSSARLPARYK